LKIHLYDDDVIIYRAILSSDDIDILQDDLNKLVDWAASWLMSLNLNKCEHLVIAIILWNALPSDIALSPGLESFKDRLEQHFAIAIGN